MDSQILYSELAETLPEHLSAFMKISVDEVFERFGTAREERNRRWVEADPKNEAERNELYVALGELDLFKYAGWHRTDTEKQLLHDEAVKVAREEGLSVLDCGGGIGDTSLAFAANGVPVTYLDFPGICADFGRYRRQQYDCEDAAQTLTPDEFWQRPDAGFGMIISIDVLEHLENPIKHAQRYRDLLTAGGHFFITAHFEHNKWNPDHLPENDGLLRIFGGSPKTGRRSVLTNLGFKKKRWYWYTKA